jgi:hypothetical protein
LVEHLLSGEDPVGHEFDAGGTGSHDGGDTAKSIDKQPSAVEPF